MKVRAHVIVSGRVQGVFFRGFTRNEARKNDVNGWVRNLPDGRVEAVFEGEKGDVDNLIKSVGEGPSYARVTRLDLKWQDFNGEFKDFYIRY